MTLRQSAKKMLGQPDPGLSSCNYIMNIEALNQRLAVIRGSLEAREDVTAVSVRELLRWAGAERRGYMVAYRIRSALKENGVSTLPDFDTVHLDSTVLIVRVPHILSCRRSQLIVHGG